MHINIFYILYHIYYILNDKGKKEIFNNHGYTISHIFGQKLDILSVIV